MRRSFLSFSVIAAAGLIVATGQVKADDASSQNPQNPQTRHQLMKDCMAKQKASDGGMPKDQMRKNCRDVTKTEKDNEKAAKAATTESTSPPHN